MSRTIILDTETTGLDAAGGDRVIEVGCVEMVNRRLTGNNFHRYLNPEREIDAQATEVHGMTWASLAGEPTFDEIADDLRGYLGDADLVIHNAPFDLGFLDHEFLRADTCHVSLAESHAITDTLLDAREKYPGQRNSLDALCTRLGVSNDKRDLHGALLDAELLADVYLRMTGGQAGLGLSEGGGSGLPERTVAEVIASFGGKRPRVVRAEDTGDDPAHDRFLDTMSEGSDVKPLWAYNDTQSLD